MSKSLPPSPDAELRPMPAAAGTPRPEPKPRAASLRYLGFEITPEGRDYSVQVSSDEVPRLFVLRIRHEAFAARQARFQDAPDLCFRRLARELVAQPGLVPDGPLQLDADELFDYRSARERTEPSRKRKG